MLLLDCQSTLVRKKCWEQWWLILAPLVVVVKGVPVVAVSFGLSRMMRCGCNVLSREMLWVVQKGVERPYEQVEPILPSACTHGNCVVVVV